LWCHCFFLMTNREFKYCPICREPLVDEEHGGEDRRACPGEACGFVHWANPIPVVSAIVERDSRVVLVRSHGWPDSWYGLIAGFLETGESPEDGMLREIREELGIGSRLNRLIGVYPFELMNQIIFVYHVIADDGDIRLCTEELADYKEVPIDKLQPWSRGTGPAVRDWLASRGYQPAVVEFGEATY